MYFRCFERFIECHDRKYPGNSPCKHGFSGTGRADHENIMAARGRDFESTLYMCLPLYIRKVDIALHADGDGVDSHMIMPLDAV